MLYFLLKVQNIVYLMSPARKFGSTSKNGGTLRCCSHYTSKTPFVVGDNIDPDCVQVPLQISRFGTDAKQSHSSLWLLRTTRKGHLIINTMSGLENNTAADGFSLGFDEDESSNRRQFVASLLYCSVLIVIGLVCFFAPHNQQARSEHLPSKKPPAIRRDVEVIKTMVHLFRWTDEDESAHEKFPNSSKQTEAEMDELDAHDHTNMGSRGADVEAQTTSSSIEHQVEVLNRQYSSMMSFQNHESCAICLSPFRAHDQVCESNNAKCSHSFHFDCASEWFVLHNDCPVCRADFLLASEEFVDSGEAIDRTVEEPIEEV